MSFSVVSFKRELYTCSCIFRFWTYSRHHKFLNILYSFLGKEGIAQTFYGFTSLDGKNDLMLPTREIRLLTFTYSKLEAKLVFYGCCLTL